MRKDLQPKEGGVLTLLKIALWALGVIAVLGAVAYGWDRFARNRGQK